MMWMAAKNAAVVILVRASSAAGRCVVCQSKKVIPGHAEALISDRIPKFVVSRPIPSYSKGITKRCVEPGKSRVAKSKWEFCASRLRFHRPAQVCFTKTPTLISTRGGLLPPPSYAQCTFVRRDKLLHTFICNRPSHLRSKQLKP